ncbi:hypothetical protein BpHYR1_051458, partial [Brachionus plicatilis]
APAMLMPHESTVNPYEPLRETAVRKYGRGLSFAGNELNDSNVLALVQMSNRIDSDKRQQTKSISSEKSSEEAFRPATPSELTHHEDFDDDDDDSEESKNSPPPSDVAISSRS